MNKSFRKFLLKSFAILITITIFFTNIGWINAHSFNYKIVLNDTSKIKSSRNLELPFDKYVNQIYNNCNLQESGLSLDLFQKSVIGFHNLSNKKILNTQKNIITIIDFTKESTFKRLWIVDLKNETLLLNTLVAHGQGSGESVPNMFSNTPESHQSSLGFYVTDEVYVGKHGLSLKLEGLDKGVNSLAKERAIVVHGADYVSTDYIKAYGRLGRSHGCPAVPQELKNQIIDLIKDKTMLYINGNSSTTSSYLDKNIAESNVLAVR